jgi:hypothetical protein
MKMLSSRAAGSLSCVLAVLLWPASAFVHTACFDAGSAVRRLRGGSTAGLRMSAVPTVELNDGTKHPMVLAEQREEGRGESGARRSESAGGLAAKSRPDPRPFDARCCFEGRAPLGPLNSPSSFLLNEDVLSVRGVLASLH